MPDEAQPDLADLRNRLAAAVKALTQPWWHSEPYRHDSRPGDVLQHATRHPPLIVQLADSTPGGAGDEGRRIADSQPPANLDAIDRLRAIDAAVTDWLRYAGARRRWSKLATRLRRLVGVTWNDDDLRRLVADAERWVVWARVTTGWDSPAFRPHVRCPACAVWDGLRVRLDQRTACCVECGTAWEGPTFIMLAEMIRLVTTDTMLLPIIGPAVARAMVKPA